MANYMKDVAKLLGVELYEEFMLTTDKETLYRIAENNLELYVNGKWVCLPSVFESLLNGKYLIIKKPWKPKKGEMYYVPYMNNNYGFIVDNWGNTVRERNQYKHGLICKTKEEAMGKTKFLLDVLKIYSETKR